VPPEPKQWQRIKEVERASLIVWYLAIGVALLVGTAFAMRDTFVHAQPGFLGLAVALYGSIGPLIFFLLGLVFVGGSVFTMIEKGRNKLWLDMELPVAPGEKLRARLGSDRALAIASGVELEATLHCKRRETEAYTDNDRQHQTRVIEKSVWSAKQRFPLIAGLNNLEFDMDIPADALPGDPGAEGLYSANRGVFWAVDVYFQRNNVYVNRSYRFQVTR